MRIKEILFTHSSQDMQLFPSIYIGEWSNSDAILLAWFIYSSSNNLPLETLYFMPLNAADRQAYEVNFRNLFREKYIFKNFITLYMLLYWY